jgi:hypothetical protein
VLGDGPVFISGNHFVDTADLESEDDSEYVPGDLDDTGMDSEDDEVDTTIDNDLLKDLEKDAKDHDIQSGETVS